MGRLCDKVAIVSGSARGMGPARVRLFAAEGARVLVTDVLEEEGRQMASDLSYLPRRS